MKLSKDYKYISKKSSFMYNNYIHNLFKNYGTFVT